MVVLNALPSYSVQRHSAYTTSSRVLSMWSVIEHIILYTHPVKETGTITIFDGAVFTCRTYPALLRRLA